tara:strand:- start:8598 stop:8855 length:258 start_codon:yes stop_codon:yes gene_type:complete
MLRENQIEKTVLFHENDIGQKIQMEYSDGARLDHVANMFKNFLKSTGYEYIDEVVLKAGDGTIWSTDETGLGPNHEDVKEDELPF